jgi:hypothetical protein
MTTIEECSQCHSRALIDCSNTLCPVCARYFDYEESVLCLKCFHAEPTNILCPECQEKLASGLEEGSPDYDD